MDGGKETWHPEPHTGKGVFRSTVCKRDGYFENGACYECSKIPKLPSFRKRLLLRIKRVDDEGKRDTTKINNNYLTKHEMLAKLSHQSKIIQKKDGEIFFSKTHLARARLRIRSLDEKLKEFARRGSMSAICNKLQLASDEGKLKDKKVLVSLFDTVSRNLHVKNKGQRYQAPLKMFYEVLMIWGGPRLVNFVALNLHGPEIHSVFRWRNDNSIPVKVGLDIDNFKALVPIFTELNEQLGIRVPVLLAEDETAIVANVSYDQARDVLQGFCGPNRPDHKCVENAEVPVGEGVQGYDTIVQAFQDKRIGTHARVIMINPLHPLLPKIPILIHPTCNRFDHEFVREQWMRVEDFYNQHLAQIVGPLCGHSSDGDTRRRKLMLQDVSSEDGDRFRPIAVEHGFIFSARKHDLEDGSYSVSGFPDQDYVHNHKKLINHLFHASRNLVMGTHIVHSNHLVYVCNRFPFEEHKLNHEDTTRNDRQNWRSAQRISFLCVQQCLQQIKDGGDDTVTGTLAYLQMVWRYVEIFVSAKATLRDRIKHAGFIIHFLGIWHNYVKDHPRYSLQKNFLSRETYTDILLSCHFAVMMICYMRDNFRYVDCRLDLTGTDVVETYFSVNGQWVGNQHNYAFARLQQNLRHMIRLEMIRVNKGAPDFAKPHPKSEIIWNSQFEQYEDANLTDYPDINEETRLFIEGKTAAQEAARAVGMAPPNDIQVFEAQWFFEPLNGHQLYESPPVSQNDSPDDESDSIATGRKSFSEDVTQMCESGVEMNSTFEDLLEEDPGNESMTSLSKSSTVTSTKGVRIQKATLVKMLNTDTKLSHDRLTRVRQRQEYKSNDSITGVANEGLCIFEDYAVIQDNSYTIVQIVRMIHKAQEYRKPVPFGDPSIQNMKLHCCEYTKVSVDDNYVYFSKSDVSPLTIEAKHVISHVYLSINADSNKSGDKYYMSRDDECILIEQVKQITKKRSVKPHIQKTKKDLADDGRRTVTVEPDVGVSGVRKSQRVRKAIVSEFK